MRDTVQIEKGLRLVQAPALIAWGTDDIYAIAALAGGAPSPA
jgi:hypothetical protein